MLNQVQREPTGRGLRLTLASWAFPVGNGQVDQPNAGPNDAGDSSAFQAVNSAAATADRHVWRGAVNQSRTTMGAPSTDR